MKICSKCGEEKELEFFYFKKDRQKYTAACKDCTKSKQKDYNAKNADKIKKR